MKSKNQTHQLSQLPQLQTTEDQSIPATASILDDQESAEHAVSGVIDQMLTLEGFSQLSGILAGYPFVKVLVDRMPPDQRRGPMVHFINNHHYQFHSDYTAEQILGMPASKLDENIDAFNQSVYLSEDRRFMLGVLTLHKKGERFFTLETVEIDNMNREMIKLFCDLIRHYLDPELPLLFKPANHPQEAIVTQFKQSELPHILSRELYATADYVPLNSGSTRGRLRVFQTELEYKAARSTLEWYDIIVMDRVPDDIPRLSGVINARHTAPLSHTNVLAAGWQIPNAIQIGVMEKIEKERLRGEWVSYEVASHLTEIGLFKIEKPLDVNQRPAWSIHRITLEEPETVNTPIASLDDLRMSDRHRYGTKAANLGELKYLLRKGSAKMLGFYKVKRPPRPHLLTYLAKLLGLSEASELSVIEKEAFKFLKENIKVPRGIAIPFSLQQEFLQSSPRIQQTIGKMKMALELNSPVVDSVALDLQNMICHARIPDRIRDYIDAEIANHLAGVSSFVVRSSSNAEDLEGFSAAGIYESHNRVTKTANIFQSIKEVWASLVSPRSVRLRHEVGITSDDSYMGVIIQEEVKSSLGGVMVTMNPTNHADFRNVYVNVSEHSVERVVHGSELPMQFLFNTVEGVGRTLSLGDAKEDISHESKQQILRLAIAGRLFQSHFSPDYLFNSPLDIEWMLGAQGQGHGQEQRNEHNEEAGIHILQLRPYSTK